MRKQRAIIFGAGGTGKRVYNMVKDDVETICFVDNDSNKWGMKYDSLCVETPEILKHKDKYDVVIMGTLMGLTEVQEQLRGYNVSPECLDKSYVEISVKARIEKAVDDFENEIGQRLYKMPIGDDITMAIIK